MSTTKKAETDKSLRVLLGSPVRQKENILAEFLESLNLLDTSGLDLHFVFVDDHNPHDLLDKFAANKSYVRVFPGNPEDSYVRDETTHYWRENLIWKIAAYKDKFIRLALQEGYDYLFLVDSDLYLQPPTLKHLISLQKEIVSEVFWTSWQPGLSPLPQAWVSGGYQLYSARRGETLAEEEINKRTLEFLQMLSVPGTYKVGMLGACTLLSKSALAAGVSFKEIYNLDLWGEDRHFCIRAAALGLELYADTHFAPFHIYRESELKDLKAFKLKIGAGGKDSKPNQEGQAPNSNGAGDAAAPEGLPSDYGKGIGRTPAYRKPSPATPKITLAMLVRNEADRYLARVLKQASLYVDEAVILDDASEDNTVEICQSVLGGISLKIVSNPEPQFNNEIVLRKQLWDLALAAEPDWVLILDADEMFEDKAPALLKELAGKQEVYHFSFRLYDMWKENFYREDAYWNAHSIYRPFMVKNVPGYNWVWQETPQHCGRFPLNISQLPGERSPLRLKHLGWMKEEDRLKKYFRYKELDPGALYGNAAQYESILEPNPKLILWED